MSELPETHVLAVASHVAYGYVGNTMATFVMQALGCEVTAINTVQFSNHTGYKQFKGRKTGAEEIVELYEGLKQSRLNDFDVLLSGYCPSAAVVEQVGKIARETRFNTTTKPGSFFWVLDPVMGDEGRIYVSEDVVPAYKSLLKDADLILPNQYEAELLSGITITDFKSLGEAVRELHRVHRVPHVIITSVRLPHDDGTPAELSIVGSTADTNFNPRLFRLNVPAFPVFFSGTGDMFAALMVARLREACNAANVLSKAHWQSPDEVEATELPLAKAAEKVLASMHMVLKKTMESRQVELQELEEEGKRELSAGVGARAVKDKERERHLRLTKAAEVRVVKNWRDLVEPIDVDSLKAHPVNVELDPNPQVKADELGVVNMGTGNEVGQGAVHQT